MVFASPDYLTRAGTPAHPDDLSRHNLIAPIPPGSSRSWKFEKDGKPYRVEPAARLKINTNDAIRDQVAGVGESPVSGLIRSPRCLPTARLSRFSKNSNRRPSLSTSSIRKADLRRRRCVRSSILSSIACAPTRRSTPDPQTAGALSPRASRRGNTSSTSIGRSSR